MNELHKDMMTTPVLSTPEQRANVLKCLFHGNCAAVYLAMCFVRSLKGYFMNYACFTVVALAVLFWFFLICS